MTSRPELKLGRHLLPGLVAVALFAVIAFVVLQSPFAAADPAPGVDGFPAQTEVANVSVAAEGTNVTLEERSDGIYAVAGEGGDGEATRVTPYTDASVETETHGGTVYAVATRPTSVTESLGYALFNLENSRDGIPAEGFLVTFEIIDVVLVAALVGAVMLARRESGEILQTALGGDDESVAADGGEEDGPSRADGATGTDDGGDR